MGRRKKPIVWHKKKSGFLPNSVLKPKRASQNRMSDAGTSDTVNDKGTGEGGGGYHPKHIMSGKDRYVLTLLKAVRRAVRTKDEPS